MDLSVWHCVMICYIWVRMNSFSSWNVFSEGELFCTLRGLNGRDEYPDERSTVVLLLEPIPKQLNHLKHKRIIYGLIARIGTSYPSLLQPNQQPQTAIAPIAIPVVDNQSSDRPPPNKHPIHLPRLHLPYRKWPSNSDLHRHRTPVHHVRHQPAVHAVTADPAGLLAVRQ